MKRRIKTLTFTASTVAFLSVVHSQTLRPSYLGEMPAPDRVMAEIKGKDAEDTSERQMGAFMALVQMMDDMAWGLEHRYVNDADTRALTPDERRLRLGYQTAYAQLWHKVTNKEDQAALGALPISFPRLPAAPSVF
jgi:arylsulfatase A-like enzyme